MSARHGLRQKGGSFTTEYLFPPGAWSGHRVADKSDLSFEQSQLYRDEEIKKHVAEY